MLYYNLKNFMRESYGIIFDVFYGFNQFSYIIVSDK